MKTRCDAAEAQRAADGLTGKGNRGWSVVPRSAASKKKLGPSLQSCQSPGLQVSRSPNPPVFPSSIHPDCSSFSWLASVSVHAVGPVARPEARQGSLLGTASPSGVSLWVSESRRLDPGPGPGLFGSVVPLSFFCRLDLPSPSFVASRQSRDALPCLVPVAVACCAAAGGRWKQLASVGLF